MIATGIFTGYYPMTIDETIAQIKKDGFSCVQLDVSFKDCDAVKEYLTKEKANLIRDKVPRRKPSYCGCLCIYKYYSPQCRKEEGKS